VAQDGRVLFVLTGSSCSGKTTAARACADVPGLAVHDHDELGVPSDADLVWRQRTLQDWIERALGYQAGGVDMLLTGQSPLGEVLACPSAPELNGIAVCLLDVDDGERLRRLHARDAGRWDHAEQQSFLEWGRWHREHAADLHARPEVIITGCWLPMRWDRWRAWTNTDPRWNSTVIDTSRRTEQHTSAEIARWIRLSRAALASRTLALANGWHRSPS
jgi:hypothetical protein